MPYAESRLEILQVRKIIQCVRDKDVEQIEKMIEKGIPDLMSYQDPESGDTALHVAVLANDEKIVSRLLELGALSSIGNKKGHTPVMNAASHGHLEVLQSLALKGINAGAQDSDGRTVLFHCLQNTLRHARCLDFIMECGANPNQTDSRRLPILCAACGGGYPRLAQVLMDRGADPNAKDPVSGKPALVLAAEGNHVECVKVLLKWKADKDADYGDGLTAVHRASALSHFDVLQTLSAYGAKFSSSTSLSLENGVHFALPAGNLNVIRFLGLRGCPANEVDSSGQNTQKMAKALGRKDLMKEVKKLSTFQDRASKGKVKGFTEDWLVQVFDWTVVNKAEVSQSLRAAEEEQLAADREAAGRRRREAEEKGEELPEEEEEPTSGLLPKSTFVGCLQGLSAPFGADALDSLAKLHDKAKTGNVNFEEFLTEQKYINQQYKFSGSDDLKAKKKKGKKKGGKKGKGKTKVAFPIVFESPMPVTSGAQYGTIEKETFFTDAQRFPRERPLPHEFVDDSMWYLVPPTREYIQLYKAVRHGDAGSLQAALQSGTLQVDLRDQYNKTPLMVACSHGRLDVVSFLIDNGADVNAIDNFCWTPLHHSCHAGEEKVVRLLLDSKANIDAQGANGGTPLMRAIESMQRPVVKLLIDRGAKVSLENKVGDDALEVARKWGDDYILALVYTKANTLPPAVNKKGKDKKDKGKGGKGKDKKKKKDDNDDELPAIGPPPPPRPPSATLPTTLEHVEVSRKKTSLGTLKAANVVKPVAHKVPTAATTSTSLQRPPTQGLYHEQKERERDDHGIEPTDFGEVRTPFTIAITARAEAVDLVL